VDAFSPARSSTSPPLPWSNFAPPFSPKSDEPRSSNFGIKAQDQVAHELQCHPGNLRRIAPASAIEDQRHRQQLPSLIWISASSRKPPQVVWCVISSNLNRCRHRKPPCACTVGSDQPPNGTPAKWVIHSAHGYQARYGKPEIFNTDQGSQFTSQAFTSVLQCDEVAISVDGRGAWRDNVMVEHLWRSVKYEQPYLRAYGAVSEARASIGWYFGFYNGKRLHSSLGARTPDQMYFDNLPLAVAARIWQPSWATSQRNRESPIAPI